MMRYTIVHNAEDNGQAHCYGTFATRAAASRFLGRIERALDVERDEAGGGVGQWEVAPIAPLDDLRSELLRAEIAGSR